MFNKLTKTLTGLAIAGVAVAGLAGCSNTEPTPTPNPTPQEEVIGKDTTSPETRDLVALSGTGVQLEVGQVLNLNVADADPSVWSGISSDDMVAKVTNGSSKDGVVMNAGVKALALGIAEITFVNSETNETVVFTINVVEEVTEVTIEEGSAQGDIGAGTTVELPDGTQGVIQEDGSIVSVD